MGNSLFEQMKKSGLVDKDKAKKIKQSQYKSQKQKNKKGSIEPLVEAKLLAQQAQAEKVERDRQLNRQRKEEVERKAIAAQIKQLIETNSVKDHDGEIAYNFVDANVVKHLYVSGEIYKHLMTGRLAIAKLVDGYALVPVPVAEKIKQRDAHKVIFCNHDTKPEHGEDDPYAHYVIPDDLMW